MLASKCVECCPEPFQMQAATLIALMLGYEWTDGKPHFLGYAYVIPSLLFAGIETKSLWQVKDANVFCGITTDNEYVLIVRDSIFVGASAKEVCLNP